MAGTGAVIEGIKDGSWYLCSDGCPMEPLDLLHLVFPNQGRNVTGRNVCFVPKHFESSLLQNLLPDASKHFMRDDFIDSIVGLAIYCILITFGMIICKYLWEFLDPTFASISPTHKKWYVVANLSKSLFLAIMATSIRYWYNAYSSFFLDEFPRTDVKRIGIMYIATDIVALYMVPKLPRSTILHHVCTASLITIMTTMDITVKGWGGVLGVFKMVILYGIFSTIAFAVNAYLALRVVYPKAKWLSGLAKFSLCLYLVCCAGNWGIHVFWIIRLIVSMDISLWCVLYLVTIAFTLVQDDVVLIKWLIKRSSPMAAPDQNGTNLKKD